MRNIKLKIEYDGGAYSGFQSQKDVLGIQEVIEDAIGEVTGEKIKLIASGRTDKGVHALGQVANFFTNSDISGRRFMFPINRNLPRDIKVLESEEVHLDFHARFDAKGKRYKYTIYNSRVPRPLYRNFSYHIIKKLDIKKMERVLPYFQGTHDFKSFMGPKTKVKDTIRTIYSIKLEKNEDFIEFVIKGNNFLRHMIRIMVGTIIYVGMGRIEVEDIPKIIDAKDRRKAGITAAPQGLILEKVYYSDNLLDMDN